MSLLSIFKRENVISHDKFLEMLEYGKIQKLATYNSEVSRGIIHNKIYKRKMKKLQEEFDKAESKENLKSVRI